MHCLHGKMFVSVDAAKVTAALDEALKADDTPQR